MATIDLASVSSGELVQANRQNGLISGISRNGAVAARVPRLIPLTPLVQATGRTVDGLILRGGSHDGPLRRWSAWFVAAGALGAGAAKRHGSPGGGADCAGSGSADGDG